MGTDNIQLIMIIVFCVIGVLAVIAIVSMSGTRGMSKMLKKAIKVEKEIIEENEDDLRTIATKSADIQKEGIEIKAKALKDGFTKNEENLYCKYCGALIDGFVKNVEKNNNTLKLTCNKVSFYVQ